MHINKILLNDCSKKSQSTNPSFEALKIDEKALKNLGCRSEKALLKKFPQMKWLSEHSDVLVKKGRHLADKELKLTPLLMSLGLGIGLAGIGVAVIASSALVACLTVVGALATIAYGGSNWKTIKTGAYHETDMEVKIDGNRKGYVASDKAEFAKDVDSAVEYVDHILFTKSQTNINEHPNEEKASDKNIEIDTGRIVNKWSLGAFVKDLLKQDDEGNTLLHKGYNEDLLAKIRDNVKDKETLRKIHMTVNKAGMTPIQKLFTETSHPSDATSHVLKYLSFIDDDELKKELVLDQYAPNKSIFSASHTWQDDPVWEPKHYFEDKPKPSRSSKLKEYMKKLFGDMYNAMCGTQPAKPPAEYSVFLKGMLTPHPETGNILLHHNLHLMEDLNKNIFDREVLRRIHLHRNKKGELPIDTIPQYDDIRDYTRALCKYTDSVDDLELIKEILLSETPEHKSLFERKHSEIPQVFVNILGLEEYQKAENEINKRICHPEAMRRKQVLIDRIKSKNCLDTWFLDSFHYGARFEPEMIVEFHTTPAENGKYPIQIGNSEKVVQMICWALKEQREPLKKLLSLKNDEGVSYAARYFHDETVNKAVKKVFTPEELQKITAEKTEYENKQLARLENPLEFFCLTEDDLTDIFEVLGKSRQADLFNILNSDIKNHKGETVSRLMSFYELNRKELPLSELYDALKDKPELLGPLYLRKFDDGISLFKSLITSPLLFKHKIDDFITSLSGKQDLLLEARKQLNECKGITPDVENHFIKTIMDARGITSDDISVAMNAIDFNDLNDIYYFLRNNPLVSSNNKSWLNETEMYGGDPFICRLADIRVTEDNKYMYSKVIDELRWASGIDFNKTDSLGIPFIEKVMHSENERLLDLNSSFSVYYYPLLDKAYERISNPEFKKKVLDKVQAQFNDIKEACKLNSTTALDRLDFQFKSPFFTNRAQKDVLKVASKSSKEVVQKLISQYSKYFSAASLDELNAIYNKKSGLSRY